MARTSARLNGPCDFGRPRPCGDVAGSVAVPTDRFAGDGRHVVTAIAADAANNQATTSREVLDRQHAARRRRSTCGSAAATAGGRATGSRSAGATRRRAPPRSARSATRCVPWRTPTATRAAARKGRSGAATSRRCPTSASAGRASGGSGSGSRTRPATPTASARCRPASCGSTTTCRRCGSARSASPTRRASACGRATPPRASRTARSRRDGRARTPGARCRPRLEADGFRATLDDETLPRGPLRAARAGRRPRRQRAIDPDDGRRRAGDPHAPAPHRHPARRRRAEADPGPRREGQACGFRTVLRMSPRTRYGRTIPLRGRLTMPGGNPLAGADVEVWERVKLAVRRLAARERAADHAHRALPLQGAARPEPHPEVPLSRAPRRSARARCRSSSAFAR